MGSNLSPVPRVPAADSPKEDEPVDYQVILTFNGLAELVDVAYPEDFTPEMVNNHLAIAALFLAQELVKRSIGKET